MNDDTAKTLIERFTPVMQSCALPDLFKQKLLEESPRHKLPKWLVLCELIIANGGWMPSQHGHLSPHERFAPAGIQDGLEQQDFFDLLYFNGAFDGCTFGTGKSARDQFLPVFDAVMKYLKQACVTPVV